MGGIPLIENKNLMHFEFKLLQISEFQTHVFLKILIPKFKMFTNLQDGCSGFVAMCRFHIFEMFDFQDFDISKIIFVGNELVFSYVF